MPNFGFKHSEKTKKIIRKKRSLQKITIGMKKGLSIGCKKIWTLEMREKVRQTAIKRKLGHGRGSDAGNWRGGRTRIVLIYRRCLKYAEWRLSVYKKDGFKCKKCKSNKNLEAHHIKSVVEIFKEYNIKTTEQMYSCDILWDVSNGETYCKDCHKETDSFGVN
jgi:hypothetical protein